MSTHKTSIRNPLAKVRGLGSAKNGTHHWWMQRVTALALIPLTLWLVSSVLSLSFTTPEGVYDWLQSPVQALALAFFLAVSCYHGKLGLQVIIEDYVHTHFNKFLLLLASSFGFTVLAVMAVLAIVKIHFA